MDIIRLDIGSPDMPPPDFIVEALHQSAVNPDHHGYAGYSGTPALRQAIADYYAQRFAVALDPATEVLPLIGSKEGIVNMALAWLDPGDLALVPDPGYPSYGIGSYLAGGETYTVPLLAANDFLPDLEAIPNRVADRARLLWLNYPNNPTAAVAPLEFFERVVTFARQHDLLICHDAPYTDIAFDGYRAPSLLQVPGAREVAVEFNSLSKSHNMAGWRVGMVVGHARVIDALLRVKSNVDSGIFRAVQDAAVVALTGDQSWLVERNAIYQQRRDMVLTTLEEVGLSARRPQAGLYVWPEVPPGDTAAGFADRLLRKTGISITPGTAFGQYGEGYLRLSLGQDTTRIKEALDRLKKFEF